MKNKISKRILAGVLTFGMAASQMPTTVFAAQTVTTSPGGTDLNVEYFTSTLYNWDGYGANQATARADNNEGKGFYFTSSNGKGNNVPDFSAWAGDAQNYFIYSGLAASNLQESSNAPFNDETVNAAPLFATDGSNESYTDVYENVKVPYVYDEETGYYTLDSDVYAVYGGSSISDGSTLSIADKPAAHRFDSTGNNNYIWVTGFLPFDDLRQNTTSAKKSTSSDQVPSYRIAADWPDYGFGMVTSVDFQMTDDGLDDKGNPITFEFSGDDDVWVYVDDTLVLDIGGTHDAIVGSINFQTGDVTLNSPAYGKIGDAATARSVSDQYTSTTLSQTNMYTALGTTRTGFASQGQHKLTIYYMERGNGRSNCLIKFNLPQRDTVSVTKQISQSMTADGTISDLTEEEQASINGVDFGFTLYKDGAAVANRNYYITSAGQSGTRTGTTDGNGHFTLKNGETATFLGAIEGSEYYVVEDTLDAEAYTTPQFSYTSTAYNESTTGDASGFQSMKVKAEGSVTATDTINFVCTNYMNADLPNPSIQPADDLIVIDYGLPISISSDAILSNDTRRGDSFEITDITTEGEYGTAALSEDHKTITYTLSKQLNGIEELTYTAVAKSGDTTSKAAEGKIKIIPATSMYYEENFSDMITYSDGQIKWQDVKSEDSYGAYQETGIVGTADDSTYGTDAVYLNNLGDSYGTSKSASAEGYAAQFEYDFQGTGTAIYSRISPDSAYIRVEISNGTTVADRQYIDTRVIGDVAANTTLYNIPVYNNSSLDYGTYHVTVTVYKAGTPVNGYTNAEGEFVDQSGSEFYLDGIRVYQPLVGDSTAESAYAADGESNIALINIRSKVVADDEIGVSGDSFVTLTDIDDNIVTLEEYTSIGPNEELYLSSSEDSDSPYTVSFYMLNWDSQSYDLYLGMKAPGGQPATVTVGDQQFTLNNSADCYYDVSDYVTVEQVDVDEDGVTDFNLGTLTITGVSGLASLTNIKVTGTDKFDIGYASDLNESGADAQTLYLLPSTYSFTADGEEDSEEAVFVPESFEINVNYAKLTKKATINVASSTDVAYITIGGTKVEPKKAGNTYSFALSLTKVTKGTTYEVIAYNSDGTASQSYTAVAE